jgi:hypothetical protein
MAVNDGIGNDIRDPFPGISAGVPNLSPGTPGASGDAADDEGAGRVTFPSGAWQPGARYPASSGGTVLPDQMGTSPVSPGPAQHYVDTGAGRGDANPYRHPAQEG